MNQNQKPMFEPEHCPKCGKDTEVEHYDTGWRCICKCGWFGVFHFDKISVPEVCHDDPYEVHKQIRG